MFRSALRRSTWLLLPFVLPSLTGCTAIGYSMGRRTDARAPDLDTLSVAQVRARPAQSPITLLLRNGGRISGQLRSVEVRPPRQTHQALAAILPAGVRLPLPGETLEVTTAVGSSSMEFTRVAMAGEEHWIFDRPGRVRPDQPTALFASTTGSGLVGIPFERISKLNWPDGTQMEGPTLAHGLSAAGPADPRAVVLTNANGTVDSVAAGTVRGIEAKRIKNSRGRGLVIGAILDVAWIAFLTASLRAASGGLG